MERTTKHSPRVDVAIRAALGPGAQIRVVPAGTVDDGMAAILRRA
jgi:hypothetical protein